jgi:hypothetical protein
VAVTASGAPLVAIVNRPCPPPSRPPAASRRSSWRATGSPVSSKVTPAGMRAEIASATHE